MRPDIEWLQSICYNGAWQIRSHYLKGIAMRIVSLLASATEMIAALGCLDQLVGRSHECDYPHEVLQLPLVSNVQIDVNATSEQIDAQIKQIAHTKDTVRGNALRALSIY